jgi:hypothetical protein
MTDEVSTQAKIKYCETSLEHLMDADKEKALYQTFNAYTKYAPDPKSDTYDEELKKHNAELDSVFPENAVGTILNLGKINDEGLDILYKFIKSELRE